MKVTLFGMTFWKHLLSSLLSNGTEKNIFGFDFQVSDLKRMLSDRMVRDNTLTMYNKVLEKRASRGKVPKQVFFVPLYWFPSLSNSEFRHGFLNHLPDLDAFDYVLWKINIDNWHWVTVYHSPAPGSTLFYWDLYVTDQAELGRMTDAIAQAINRVSSILGREWAWKKGHVTGEGIVVPGPSLISAPPQQVNELGRRLMFDESVSSLSWCLKEIG